MIGLFLMGFYYLLYLIATTERDCCPQYENTGYKKAWEINPRLLAF